MRVLVDTNIWIDHLRNSEPVLVDLLERDQVCVHQSVITELALGNLKNRSVFLKAIERLMIVRNVDDRGVRHLVEERRLWGRGLSAVDASRGGYATTYRRSDNSPILGVKLEGEWYGVCRSADDARADSQ